MRSAGWEERLATFLASPAPFAWGRNDCALWSALWVREATGEDFTAPWLGKYKSAAGARKRMAALGFADVAAIASKHLTEIAVPLARRGDLVLHPSEALGVCDGLKSHFLTDAGRHAEDTLRCPRAWRVG